jgi:hypothetical protein
VARSNLPPPTTCQSATNMKKIARKDRILKLSSQIELLPAAVRTRGFPGRIRADGGLGCTAQFCRVREGCWRMWPGWPQVKVNALTQRRSISWPLPPGVPVFLKRAVLGPYYEEPGSLRAWLE